MEGTAVDTAAVPTAVREMDEALYDTLNNMLSSGDKENYIIAENILLTVTDPASKESIYWTWRLMKHHFWKLNRRRKAVREYINKVVAFQHRNEYTFGEYLMNKEKMTDDTWARIGPEILRVQEYKCKNVFFNVELKQKQLWSE
jgi:hypothetical protein